MSGKRFGRAGRLQRRAGLGLAAALAVALIGCGASEEKLAEKSDSPLRVPVDQAAVASALSAPSGSVSVEEGEVVASADSLPPEIAVEVADPRVEPGEAIEISALGSPDVRDVILTDGMGKATSFAYDLQAKAWKAYYRVPMKRHGEHIALSVTAKNDGQRWRRVWLFLDVEDQTPSTASGSATPDSTQR